MQVEEHIRRLAGDASEPSFRHRDRSGSDRGSGAHRRLRLRFRKRMRQSRSSSARCPKGARSSARISKRSRHAATTKRSPTRSSIPALQERLFPDREGLALANPISADLSVMRVSLWPGLLHAARENQRRQQDRVRLFEHGTRFDCTGGALHGDRHALRCGLRRAAARAVGRCRRTHAAPSDFFDVKADVEALICRNGRRRHIPVRTGDALSCLHPGRAARIAARRRRPWAGSASCTRRLVRANGALHMRRCCSSSISRRPWAVVRPAFAGGLALSRGSAGPRRRGG